MKKCCFCINLKLGTLIISILSLGAAFSVIFSTIATLCDSFFSSYYAAYGFSKPFTIVSLIVYSLLFVAFSFGFYVSIQEKRVDLIERYALILYAYVFISAAMNSGMIFILMNNKKEYCEMALRSDEDCTNLVLIGPIINIVINIIINIYFARVVSAYAEQTEFLLRHNTPRTIIVQV
ncbi:hypothetical protein Glove_94g31 [Diversispora epigaea]|uniref:G-protein coupled receptors family 1 profile domain-containing protein n=1 Tax=Diversispora epigaea TaxID=1348612 RepID=A0A397JFM1_9GLOM|nr:hypothetical protein Glove_94g31 [Diversispora epigaea]